MSDYQVIENYEGDLKGGQEARQYPDGSVRNEKGFMLEPLPGAKTITTSERGREVAQVKQEQHRNAFRRGLKKAAKVDINGLDGEELSVYAEHAGEQFLKSTNIRGMAELLAKFGSMGGYIADERAPLNDDDATVSALAALGAEMVEYITRRAQERSEG
jgi:hypothetical protein